MIALTQEQARPAGLLDKAETAKYLGVSIRQMERIIASGQIRARRLGRQIRITVADVERYVSSLPAANQWGGPAHERDRAGQYAGRAVRP